MAKIVRTETRKRGTGGLITKWVFILFNVLMIYWTLDSIVSIGGSYDPSDSEAGRAGSAIGGAMVLGFIATIWTAGAVVLGIATLLTRGKKIVVEEVVDETTSGSR